jgi:hypothetical protein
MPPCYSRPHPTNPHSPTWVAWVRQRSASSCTDRKLQMHALTLGAILRGIPGCRRLQAPLTGHFRDQICDTALACLPVGCHTRHRRCSPMRRTPRSRAFSAARRLPVSSRWSVSFSEIRTAAYETGLKIPEERLLLILKAQVGLRQSQIKQTK